MHSSLTLNSLDKKTAYPCRCNKKHSCRGWNETPHDSRPQNGAKSLDKTLDPILQPAWPPAWFSRLLVAPLRAAPAVLPCVCV